MASAGTEPAGARLPVIGQDRSCAPRALDNPLRRWLAPARREIDMLRAPSGGRVADLGAGVGFYATEILRRIGDGGELWLVEPDSDNLSIAAERVGHDRRVRLLARTAARAPDIVEGTLDRVLLSLVLCCLVDKEGVMDEAWRILRPGGLALITYPRIGPGWLRRRRSLRITPARWTSLTGRRNWAVEPVVAGRLVRRHLLRKSA
jgi:SAM-dependent methyltransferase